MAEHLVITIAAILALGALAQWLSWRLKLPSIVLLLLFGFASGSVTGIIDPDRLLGDLLFPIVSVAVAIILFEGGLSLRIAELRAAGTVVRNLVTIGVVVTWLIGAAGARAVLDVSWGLALLLGAVLVVSGPTVVLPLLRLIRPSGPVGAILKWEAILIDPIGATLALLVFEWIAAAGTAGIGTSAFGVIIKTLATGGLVGVASAAFVAIILRRYWVPDFLENAVVLSLVVCAFAAANHFQSESGLLAVTVMGTVLANQRSIPIKHIVAFKENLRVLLISALFILLSARLDAKELAGIVLPSLGLVLVTVLVARPLSAILCTWNSKLKMRERWFLAAVAPRGIVAAAVASVFALRLADLGYPQADLLVPVTFVVIAGTVTLYGIAALPLARRLQVAESNPQGALIIGAHAPGRAIAKSLKNEGYSVLLVDSNWDQVAEARMAGLPAVYANALSEHVLYELDLRGIGRLLALTANDEVNSLAALHFGEVFGRSEVYQLPLATEQSARKAVSHNLQGRPLFAPGITYYRLSRALSEGAEIKSTLLTKEFDYQQFKQKYADSAIPLFLVTEDEAIEVVTPERTFNPRPGQKLITLATGPAPDDRRA